MTAPRKDPPHLTIAQLAERQQVKVATVYCWISRGTAPSSTGRGRGRRFPLADVLAWDESRRTPA